MTDATTIIDPPQMGPGRHPPDEPVPVAWREGTLTRARELQSLSRWLGRLDTSARPMEDFLLATEAHIEAARDAARHTKRRWWRPMNGPLLERAISNLDAAQANILQVAPVSYVVGQMPSLLNLVQRHLPVNDPRRQEFERVADSLGVHDGDRPPPGRVAAPSTQEQQQIVEKDRNKIVSIVRGASSAGLREQLRVRSFKTVLVATAGVMFLLAVGLGILGWASPTTLPLCFQPQQNGQTVVVCPTGQSQAVPAVPAMQPAVDALVGTTVRPADVLVVELVGLIAASVAAAAAMRRIRGSSEPYGLPVVLALLKLPTGALTAVLGLLLMRGEFVPGLSALDTSAQILGWAIIFGYAQQLFTRLVDQQADSVLDGVRGNKQSNGELNAT